MYLPETDKTDPVDFITPENPRAQMPLNIPRDERESAEARLGLRSACTSPI